MINDNKSIYYGVVAYCVALGAALIQDNKYRHFKDDITGVINQLEKEHQRAKSRRWLDSSLFSHEDVKRVNQLQRLIDNDVVGFGGQNMMDKILKRHVPSVERHIDCLNKIIRGKIVTLTMEGSSECDKAFANEVIQLLAEACDYNEETRRTMNKEVTLSELDRLFIAREQLNRLVVLVSDYGSVHQQRYDTFQRRTNPLEWLRRVFIRG